MVIDFHTHVFPRPFRERREALCGAEPAFASMYGSPRARCVGVEDLLQSMDMQQVDRSVIFGFPWDQEELYRRHNDYIIEAVTRVPQRLTGLCCVSPGGGAAREAERCLRAGLCGVGEVAVYGQGLSRDTIASLEEVMSLCASYDVPFLLHTNEPVGHQYPGKAPMTLGEIYRFVETYRANRIVLAHWGGGLMFYALMKKEVKEVLSRVWFDTAASPYLYDPAVYRMAEALVGPDKILFGSDFPLISPCRYLEEMRSAGLSTLTLDKVTGMNAAKLLKLAG